MSYKYLPKKYELRKKTNLKLACNHIVFNELLAKTLEDYKFFKLDKVLTNEKALTHYLTRQNKRMYYIINLMFLINICLVPIRV